MWICSYSLPLFRSEHNWNATEHNKKKDSPVLRVHFEDNWSKDEANRDMSVSVQIDFIAEIIV